MEMTPEMSGLVASQQPTREVSNEGRRGGRDDAPKMSGAQPGALSGSQPFPGPAQDPIFRYVEVRILPIVASDFSRHPPRGAGAIFTMRENDEFARLSAVAGER